MLLCVTLSCDREDSFAGTVNYISYGTSFVECQGYCIQYMKVYPRIAALSQYGWDESYGCPDCNDGGAEWVEIRTRRAYSNCHSPARNNAGI